MGQLKSMELPESGSHTTANTPAARPSRSLWWLWVVLIAGVVLGVWYFRGSRTPSEAANPSAPATPGRGRGGSGGMGNFVVPVVVAPAQPDDLPVYFNGLGTVTAFNTVTVRSRVDGEIIKVAFKEGQYVHEGDLLVQIDPRPFQVQLEQADTQLQPIAVLFSLPQDDLPQVSTKLRAGAQLTVDAFDRDDTQKIATGKLLTIDNQIDPSTGTYKLKSVFNNADTALFPNQFVNVHLLVDTKHNLTIVPAAAIQRGPQGTYVYAVASDNTVKIHAVTIAQTTGNRVGLSDGVNAGDLVVIDGQDKLQDGSKVTPTASSGNNSGAQASSNTAPASPGAPAPPAPNSPRRQSGGSRR